MLTTRPLAPAIAVLLGAGLLARVAAEDYSELGGLVVAVEGAASNKRGLGVGADGTLILMFFNASISVRHYQDEYKDTDTVLSGYAGIGLINAAMLQAGLDNDGFAWRVHGAFGFSQLAKGDFVSLPPGKDRKMGAPRDVMISYSAGMDSAGYNVGLGMGVVF